MSIGYFFGMFVVVSVISIRVGMLVMGHFGILDQPGGHKQHAVSTPFVGGFGVIAALITAVYFSDSFYPEISLQPLRSMAIGGVILFLTGLADDIWRLHFRTRLLIQAVVAMVMIFLGGIELRSLGKIAFENDIALGWISVPFTIFATVGLINALNMIDGIDGISGALSFITLGFVALLAALANNRLYLLLIIAVMGGVAGFLYFNLRSPWNRRARVFLGDNGSMLLGFVFAWLFIALSQGEHKAMTPVTALWLFCVPLMDTVSVMMRRIWMGRSPFHADRNHLHHLFIRAGFRVSDTVWIVSFAQIALGAIGLGGLMLNIPEYLMFSLFLGIFGVYFYFIVLPWRFVPALRKLNLALGLPCAFARGIFVGYFQNAASQEILELLTNEIGTADDYRLTLRQLNERNPGARDLYGVLETAVHDDEISIEKTQRMMTRIKARLDSRPGVKVHLLIHRSKDNDRRRNRARYGSRMKKICTREADRRELRSDPEIYSTIIHKGRAVTSIDTGVQSIHSAF